MGKFLATITPVGASLFLVEEVSRPVDPGFGGGIPDYDGGHPDQGLPWQPGHPDQGLPGYGHPGNRPPGSWEGRPDQGLPGQGGHPGNRPPGSWGGRPGNALPIPPVRPSTPIVLPPGVWPPSVPSIPGHPDNSLPPEAVNKPIEIPPDPNLGIEQPIVLPPVPQGVALLISLPQAQPKADAPANAKPAILIQSGQKPVLVYVSATATPK